MKISATDGCSSLDEMVQLVAEKSMEPVGPTEKIGPNRSSCTTPGFSNPAQASETKNRNCSVLKSLQNNVSLKSCISTDFVQ
jgi:hypothetical protein